MMKVYDMVTYSLCAPTDNALDAAPDQTTATARHTGLPQTGLGLQPLEAAPASRASGLHPALRHTDVDSFLAAIDR